MSLIRSFLVILLLSSWAAAGPITFGAEFELTHQMLSSAWEYGGKEEARQAKEIFVQNLRRICQFRNCRVAPVPGKWQDSDYRVVMSDGWWFKVSHDPECVEITTRPSSLFELKAQAQIINEMIFQSGHGLGFFVKNGTSRMSHVNFGLRSAFATAEDFLRFFVDYQNRPDLALGSLGRDLNNAPPLAILGAEQREALQKLVQRVNSGELTDPVRLANLITETVYTKSHFEPWGAPEHYQAIGLKYMRTLFSGDAPVELRAVRIQESAEDFIAVAELIEARIAFLKKQKKPIIYNESSRKDFSEVELNTRFYIYLVEAGLNPNRYLKYFFGVTKNKDFPLAPFVRSVDSMDVQLNSLKEYQDLLPHSEWLRQKKLELESRKKPAIIQIIESVGAPLCRSLNFSPAH